MKFQDYYETLGVSRTATTKEIQTAFRKLARKYHPDVNKAADGAEKFKLINEAYEVLRDPEKRQKYDLLGENYRSGQDFTPPPGWGQDRRGQSGGTREFHFGGASGDFSDFFSAIFGEGQGGFAGFSGAAPRGRSMTAKGGDREAELTITLEELMRGEEKQIQLAVDEPQADGQMTRSIKDYSVKIPRGVGDGARIRLRGQGSPGRGGGPAGDLYLILRLAPHPVFTVDGADLKAELKVTPWEAILGAKVEVPILDGKVMMTIPAGAQGGQRFRLRDKGLPRDSGRGDLYVTLQIVVPPHLTEEEKSLVEQLGQLSTFNPRIG